MASADLLTIGKFAQQGGVNIQTIRYYERRGLIPKPNRSSSGYRLYDEDAIRLLGFVRKAQLLGFSLQEIDELLSLRMRPGITCADIRKRARQKIAGPQSFQSGTPSGPDSLQISVDGMMSARSRS